MLFRYLSFSISLAITSATAGTLPGSADLSNQDHNSYRLIQRPDGSLQRELVHAAANGTQKYIIELQGKAVLPRLQQHNNLSGMQQIAAPLLLQAENQLKAEQQQLSQQLLQDQLISDVHASTSLLLNSMIVSANPADISKIAALPQVKKVHADRELKLYRNRSIPLIQADKAWALKDNNSTTLSGKGVRVGVLDTGIDYSHPDLGGCFGEDCKVAGGYDFYNNDADPIDTDGHGTHVAGIIAGHGTVKGVAPEATLYAYQVCDYYCPTSYVIQALERSADPDQNPLTKDALDIVNLSLGGPGSSDDPLTIAANNASKAGIVVVVAAGNDGEAYDALGTPGNAELAITVAASDFDDNIADFSSRGPGDRDLVLKPDLAAPGSYINSTMPNGLFEEKSGTSMAAPHVAGAAALLKQQDNNRTPDAIKSLLVNSSKDLQQSILLQGSGRLDVLAAASANLTLSPQSISFGKLDTNQSLWQQQKTLVVQNTSASSNTVTLEQPELPAGVSLTMTPSGTVTIAGGARLEIQLQLTVNTSIYQQPANNSVLEDLSLSIRSEQITYRLPMAFLAYHPVKISSPHFIEQLQIYNEKGKKVYNNSAWGNTVLRMVAGSYDVIARFLIGDETRIVLQEQQLINQPQTLLIDPALASYQINLTSVKDREGNAVPLDALKGGIHTLEIRHQSKPVYFLKMYGVLGETSWGNAPGPTLTGPQSLFISPIPDKFQLAMTAFWQDKRAAADDVQIYSWTQRFSEINNNTEIQLDATTQNRLVTQIAAADFTQYIAFSYSILRGLTSDDLMPEDRYGTVGLGYRIAEIAANQSAKVSIYGTAPSFKPDYGVGQFSISMTANDYMNSVYSDNWRFYGEKGASQVSLYGQYGSSFRELKNHTNNPAGQQTLTLMPHWASYWAHVNGASFDVRAGQYWDIYGNRIKHESAPQYPAEYSALLRCDQNAGEVKRSSAASFTFDKNCTRYDVELKYTTALLNQATPSFSRLTTFAANRYNDLSIYQVRIGSNQQPTQQISQGKGFFEFTSDNADAVSAEIYFHGTWRPLTMQLSTPDANSLPVYRGEFELPDSPALASVRYIATHQNGNSLESLFHNAAIVGPNPEAALRLDHDQDGIADFQDNDDDNDGMDDIDELRYRLDLYKDDRESDLDNDGLTNLQELKLTTFPDRADSDQDGIHDGFEHQYGLNPLDNSDAQLDPDQDELSNLQEFIHKTQPAKADTDGDTMTDGYEVKYSLNPLDIADANTDVDQDSLSNLEEFKLRTNPKSADTDKDGMDDGYEVKYRLNPLDIADANTDLDLDSLSNLNEFKYKTNPTLADTDGDGMPDGYEVQYSLNPLDAADATSDKDQDGFTALQEFQAGTNPTVSDKKSGGGSSGGGANTNEGGGGGGSMGFSVLSLAAIWCYRRQYRLQGKTD